jgi:hypothetical protein
MKNVDWISEVRIDKMFRERHISLVTCNFVIDYGVAIRLYHHRNKDWDVVITFDHHFMEPSRLFLCAEQVASGSCPEPDESGSHYPSSLICILILSSVLGPIFETVYFLQVFQPNSYAYKCQNGKQFKHFLLKLVYLPYFLSL